MGRVEVARENGAWAGRTYGLLNLHNEQLNRRGGLSPPSFPIPIIVLTTHYCRHNPDGF